MHDINNFFYGVENEDFVFLLDNMHESISNDEFQFDVGIHKHADHNFHNEKVYKSEASFCEHYESEVVYSVLLSELFQNVYLTSKTDMDNKLILPHEERDENYVYDRDK